jgi:hypothetical protein
MNAKWSRRAWACLVVLTPVLLPACEPGGHFTFLGYTTLPNYNTEIRTVRVPIFKNETVYRGMEFQLTEAVIREIELKTPFKVVTAGCPADTELTGKIITYTKSVVIPNQLNEVREMETTLAVEVVWRDLRPGHSGEVLSQPVPRPPSTESVGPPPVPPTTPPVVLVQSLATAHPELGESLATAQKKNVDRAAVQIISMMEKPW